MKQQDIGIKGSNPGCWALTKDERYCDICLKYISENFIQSGQKGYNFGRDDELRMFHYIGTKTINKYTFMKDHIAVCNKCLDKILEDYYGCGCGG